MELDPVVLGILSFVGAAMILAVLITVLCVMCKKCSNQWTKPGLPTHEPQSRHGENSGWLTSEELQVQTSAKAVELNSEANISTLKESVLSGNEPPPSYQMVTEYPRVYAGQYYIGMNGKSEIQPWMSHQNQMDHFDT